MNEVPAPQEQLLKIYVADKEYFGRVVKNYKDPFVFTSCDVVCKTIEEVAHALTGLQSIKPKTLEIIPDAVSYYLSQQSQ
jgi:hypothetical protein